MLKTKILISFVSIVFMLCGCQKRDDTMRTYEEVYRAPAWASAPQMPMDDIHARAAGNSPDMKSMPVSEELMASVGSGNLTWETPSGWTEKSGGGLRVASFTDSEGKIDVSIVSLKGEAGGLEANLTRWAGQAGFSADPQELVTKLKSSSKAFKTKSGLAGQMYDYRIFEAEANTIVASVINAPDMAIFVKMTGAKADVDNNFNAFNELNKSIQVHD